MYTLRKHILWFVKGSLLTDIHVLSICVLFSKQFKYSGYFKGIFNLIKMKNKSWVCIANIAEVKSIQCSITSWSGYVYYFISLIA